MMKGAKLLVLTILLVSAGFSPLCGDIAPFTMPSPRFNGLGGYHTAYASDINALWVNPAALKGAKEFSLLEVSGGFYGPVFDLLKTMEAGDPMDALIDLLGGTNGFAAGADVGGPLSIGTAKNGFGLGFFNRAYFDGSFAGTMADVSLNVDVFGTLGFAFRLFDKGGHVLDVGALAKAFVRGNVILNANLLNLETDDILEGLLDNPINITTGFGFDLGIQYEYARRFRLAVVCTDVYSPGWTQTMKAGLQNQGGGISKTSDLTYAGTIAPRVSAGIMANLFDWKLMKLNIMVDYRDIFAYTRDGISRNPLLNLGAGAELELFKFLNVRVGMADCLPAVGLGFNLFICKIDLSIRGVELGLDPGVKPVYAFDAGVAFRW